MKAVVVHLPGGVNCLHLEDVAEPAVDAGSVLVKVEYAACNWGDVQKRMGIYPDPISYPAILGGEGSGRVVACGKGVRSFRSGQPVAFISGTDMLRGFAEYVSVPAELVMPIPPDLDLRLAAAIPVASLTAYHLLYTASSIRRGDRILIHAISGGVGLALTQLAVAAGAIVYGTVGSVSKRDVPTRLGAQVVVARDAEDFVDVILKETAHRGVDLVIDSLGSGILERSFDVVRRFGRVINIGEAAGDPEFQIRETLYKRSTSLAGFELMHANPGSRCWRRGVRKVMAALAAGELVMPIADEFSLDDIADAQTLLEGRSTVGKVLVRVS